MLQESTGRWAAHSLSRKDSMRRWAVLECFERIPCNPCEVACRFGAIVVGDDINALPQFHEEKCTGCGTCLEACPGLAVFMIEEAESEVLVGMPYEFLDVPREGDAARVLDRSGNYLCQGMVRRVQKPRRNSGTYTVYVAVPREHQNDARGLAWGDSNG